jgi:hypothetical protein
MVVGQGVNSGAASPAPELFSFEPLPGLRPHNPAGDRVSICIAASEYIPLGGAVLFWAVPNSLIGGSFGVDARSWRATPRAPRWRRSAAP